MASTPWYRLWNGMPNDPKWRTIARVSKQRIGDVIAVFLHVLENASNASERGRTENLISEDIASALDLETEQVEDILAAMQSRVLDGPAVTAWGKRQPAREDGAAERAKNWRESKKAGKDPGLDDSERDRTQPNAAEREKTPRGEEIREEKSNTTPSYEGVAHATPGEVCKAMKRVGLTGLNPSHPTLTALLAEGLTLDEFVSAAEDAVEKKKPFAYALATAEGRRRDAVMEPLPARRAANAANFPPPKAQSFAAQDRDAGMRRWEEMTGRVHPERTQNHAADVIDITPTTQLLERS